jgi:hypothetical protein
VHGEKHKSAQKEEDLSVFDSPETLVFNDLIPNLGRTRIYYVTKTGCSMCFQGLNAYVKHCLKTHSEFSLYAFERSKHADVVAAGWDGGLPAGVKFFLKYGHTVSNRNRINKQIKFVN